jgi:hypothetical protein
LAGVFFVLPLLAHANNANGEMLTNATMVFSDSEGNPIKTALDLRISLWDDYYVRSGDINSDGSINTAAKHYGYYQTTKTATPDQGYIGNTLTQGYYVLDLASLPDFPLIGPINPYLQVEYKYPSEPDTAYRIYDFYNDPPWNNVTRLLIDPSASYYVLDAGPATKWNTFTLDANDNAPTAIVLQFGETLGKQLKWDIANVRFELTGDFKIDGSLALGGPLDFSLFEMKNARLENLASAPACDSGSKGRLYYNTGDNLPYYCNGTGWNQL